MEILQKMGEGTWITPCTLQRVGQSASLFPRHDVFDSFGCEDEFPQITCNFQCSNSMSLRGIDSTNSDVVPKQSKKPDGTSKKTRGDMEPMSSLSVSSSSQLSECKSRIIC